MDDSSGGCHFAVIGSIGSERVPSSRSAAMNASLCKRWQQLLLTSSLSSGAVVSSQTSSSIPTRRWCETQHFVRQMSGHKSNDDEDEELSEFLGMQ